MKTLTSSILGLTLALGTAGFGLAAQTPSTETQPPAKATKTKHRKHHTKKAKKTATPPANNAVPAPTK